MPVLPPQHDTPDASSGLLSWLLVLKDLWTSVLELRESFRTIAYADIVAWVTEHAKHGVAGVALLRHTESGVDVVALILDDAREPVRRPDGRLLAVRFRAPSIDAELTAAFGDRQLILFE